MNESGYDSQIERVAALIIEDKTPLDEQDPRKLAKYYDFAKKHFHLKDEYAIQLVNEAFLYLKLRTSDSIDPLQHGDEFGAGFS